MPATCSAATSRSDDPEFLDPLAREGVERARSLPAACQEAGARERLEVMRSVGNALVDLTGDVVDGAFALREHVDDLCPSATRECLGDFGERVEECILGFTIAHR